ncbi:hypothetical protein KFK09_021049 [Dendrobium nobile]|uniref:Non-specific serine/threonine protein kinase n=1 Tax=Dendrobium nobile TaxID=94219 RepID=A0A8T3AQ03_DENNO|nr:hypothetical protein KFK09_021049 [Dendrobium nobile]
MKSNLVIAMLSDSGKIVLKCMLVGLLCVHENVADRSTMASIVYMLGWESTSLLIPKKPQFTRKGNFVGMDPSTCYLYINENS